MICPYICFLASSFFVLLFYMILFIPCVLNIIVIFLEFLGNVLVVDFVTSCI